MDENKKKTSERSDVGIGNNKFLTYEEFCKEVSEGDFVMDPVDKFLRMPDESMSEERSYIISDENTKRKKRC